MADAPTLARELAFHFEARKVALTQRQDGWTVSFHVQAVDLPNELRDAPKGTRYVIACVEKGDDEMPVVKETKEPVKRKWNERTYPERAGLLSANPDFWEWASVHDQSEGLVESEAEAARFIRNKCGVTSRKEILPGSKAGAMFDHLLGQFLSWKREVGFADAG